MEKEERRFLPLKLKIEKRENEPEKIVGYAAKFNSLSEDLGGFREKIKPGAFKNALKVSDTRALFNHDRNYVLGRQSAGTLTLKEDKTGLYIEIDPPDTSFARDLMVSIRRGDVNQQSFGFTVAKDEWKDLDGDEPLRTLTEISELFDVSPVTFPAYPDTNVAVRSLEIAKQTQVEDLAFVPVSDTADEIKVEIKIKRIQVELEVNGKPLESPYEIRLDDSNETKIEIETKTETETEADETVTTSESETRADNDKEKDSTDSTDTDTTETRTDNETVVNKKVADDGQINPDIGNTEIDTRDLFKNMG